MNVQIFQGTNNEWYWRIIAANGKIIADGAEGYDSKSNVLRAVRTFLADVRAFKWEHE